MSDEQQDGAPVILKPKPKRRKKRGPAKVMKFESKQEFPGMTPNDCCDGCKLGHCVISETGVCTHPHKSPIQTAMMANPKVFERYMRAKKMLEHQKIDLRGT